MFNEAMKLGIIFIENKKTTLFFLPEMYGYFFKCKQKAEPNKL